MLLAHQGQHVVLLQVDSQLAEVWLVHRERLHSDLNASPAIKVVT